MLVSILVPLAALTAYNVRPRADEFEALASGLTSSESSAVLGHLEVRHVPYVLKDGGQTVMVPATQRAELTVELNQLAFLRGELFPVRLIAGAISDDRNTREIGVQGPVGSGRAQAQARGASEQ